MTMHTRAATDDIYEIFNKPKQEIGINDDGDTTAASEDDYETDGDYTSGAESIETTRDVGDDEVEDEEQDEGDEREEREGDMNAPGDDDEKSVSEWSDFTARRHIPDIAGEEEGAMSQEEYEQEDEPDEVFSPLPVRGFPVMGGREEEEEEEQELPQQSRTRTSFIPIPPEDYVAPTRPFRDPVEMANNRLPFMTPITERTESSLEFDSDDNKRALHAKTPSKPAGRSLPMPYLDEDDGDEDEYVEEEEELEAVEEEDEDDDDEEDGEDDIPKRGTSEPMSSPLIDIVDDGLPEPAPFKIYQPPAAAEAPAPVSVAPPARVALAPKGPIIKDLQCNPIDESIRAEILANIHPPLKSYTGFYDHREEKSEKGSEIRRYAKAVSSKSKANGNNGSGGSDRSSGAGVPVVIQFSDGPSRYTVRRELGAGAFAPVYLVENMNPDGDDKNAAAAGASGDEDRAVAHMGRGAFASAHSRRHAFEALKMETPPTAWEFHMMRLAHTRLGPQHRATASLAPALECHLYRDETFLFLPFYPHGTMLDVVNLFRSEPSGVMDETLAMFFAIELFRTVEALHAKNILHGDIKADNCLLRLEDPLSPLTSSLNSSTGSRTMDGNEQLSGQWHADGSGGWAARGMTLIDFGRGIDMRAFSPDVKFVADWKTTAQDCAEMREGRPWTWHIDYHGLAGALHCLLFGKYMETVRSDQGMGAGFDGADSSVGGAIERGPMKRYRIRETLKRYWQTDIWSEAFELLLNPAGFVAAEDGGRMPTLRSMRQVRERMETWLAANCERGVGLKSLMVKIEHWARTRK